PWPPALSAARIARPARHLRSRWSSSFSFPYLVLPRAKRRVLLCVFHRQCHVEPRAPPLPHGALPIHLAAELGHPSSHNRQTQSRSLRLCREERLEVLFSPCARSSRPIVVHRHGTCPVVQRTS